MHHLHSAGVVGAELYQPLAIETLTDPFPIYRRLLREAPVFWHNELYAWVISRHRDCWRVLQSPTMFTRDRRKLGRPVPAEGMTIQTLDPPDQIELRQALMRAVRRSDMVGVCGDAMGELRWCVSRQPEGREFDFMSQVASHVAIRFAASLIGMPDMTPDAYRSIFFRLTRAMDRALDPGRYEDGVQATHELNIVIESARSTAPRFSLIHELYAVPGVAEMPVAYVRNTISATFNAAYSTAYSAMGSILVLAMERPGLARNIVAGGNPSAGVEELLRFTSPAQSTRRFATRDIAIGGAMIRENDPVLTLMAAANRDPEEFENPDELVLDRMSNRHLAFGSGAHHCIGARPAREFLKHFVGRLADLEGALVMAGPCRWLDTFTLRCLDHLPVVRRAAMAQ